MRKPNGGLFGCVSKKQKHTGAQRGVRKYIEKDPRARHAVELRRSIYEPQQALVITCPAREDKGLLLQPAAGAAADLNGIKKYSVTTAILTGNADSSAAADSTEQFAGEIRRVAQY